MIEEIIKVAKEKYPLGFFYTYHFKDEKEIEELEKYCDVKCFAPFMDGSATYHIRYKGE